MNEILARLLGYGPDDSIRGVELSAAAPWARAYPLAAIAGCLLLAVGGVWFYLQFQPLRRRNVQYLLAGVRGALLCLVLLLLVEPTLEYRVTSRPKPWLWLLLDGSASMAIEDAPLTPNTSSPNTSNESLATGSTTATGSAATGGPLAGTTGGAKSGGDETNRQTRLERMKAALTADDGKLLKDLESKFRVRAFLFDRPGEVRPLAADDKTGGVEGRLNAQELAAQLTAEGQVTALGDALHDLRERYAARRPAGLVVFSDFNKNAGLEPTETAARLGVPVYCVGFGPKSAVDVAVDLQANLLMKKGEQSELRVTVRREGGATGEVTVRLKVQPLGTDQPPRIVGERTIPPGGSIVEIPFPYTPDETGRMEFVVDAEPQAGETITDNNRAQREVNVRDDFLHLMFVDYEPNWEWRFVKEVFHRDRLVGMRGFRTFLRSADPKVRQTNELFLPSLTPPRGEFFVNDVIFLGDMPATSLSTRYCEMLKEFVDKFGGGLVILSGPTFGPGELASTPLVDLLPVQVSPGSKLVDAGKQTFTPRLTDAAADVDFMQLSADAQENRKLWSRFGPLEWFQPVAGVHDQATVLLEHPTLKCPDGKTPYPLLAIRRYGKGEVVYLAVNETWRLRREYGETYYRKFWGQMIHRLGLSHALGSQKRFVVRTDRRQYQSGQRVVASVEAYDQNYEPLTADKLPQPQLIGEVIAPAGTGAAGKPPQRIRLSQFRDGVFQTEFDVDEPGEYVVKVIDPLSNEPVDAGFRVANLSAERRSAVRNVALETDLASLKSERFGVTGERFDETEAAALPGRIFVPDEVETSIERVPLWNTWPAFLLIVILMLVEWFVRKWVHLP